MRASYSSGAMHRNVPWNSAACDCHLEVALTSMSSLFLLLELACVASGTTRSRSLAGVKQAELLKPGSGLALSGRGLWAIVSIDIKCPLCCHCLEDLVWEEPGSWQELVLWVSSPDTNITTPRCLQNGVAACVCVGAPTPPSSSSSALAFSKLP